MNDDTEFNVTIGARPELARKGDTIELTAAVHRPELDTQADEDHTDAYDFRWSFTAGPEHKEIEPELFKTKEATQFLTTDKMAVGLYRVRAEAVPKMAAGASGDPTARARRARRTDAGTPLVAEREITVQTSSQAALADRILSEGVSFTARTIVPTADQALWVKMRNCLESRRFEEYNAFINKILCGEGGTPDHAALGTIPLERCRYQHGVNGYQLLKAATEVYLLCRACCGGLTRIGTFDEDQEHSRLGYRATREDMQARLTAYLESSVSPATLPYLRRILENLNLDGRASESFPYCADSVRGQPCLFELIWSYWQEQGMLMQGINAIAMRFQNRRIRPEGGPDPLAHLALDPLRPLNNLLWGYIQDAHQRLSVSRRAYEYEHEYGLRLQGKAVGNLQPVERRTGFLEAFNNLLHAAAIFYHDEQNKMVEPDPFPILEKIRSVHLLLAEGAQHQFGDMPSTARIEMMIAQWLIAQPPMREFLQSRPMVPYAEPWMGQIDALRKLMGWPDVSVGYFARLAKVGEMILLSIRYGHWTEVIDPKQAENWIRYWRPEIQGYIEAYRIVTGVDLSAGQRRDALRIDATQPSELLRRRRMAEQVT